MSAEFEALNRINALKESIESVTGDSYTDLTEAVQALKDKNSSSEEEQYQIYEVKFDFVSGYIGPSSLNNNIIVVEVAEQVEKEDGSVEVLPENAIIKKVEFFFNGEMHCLEDVQKIDNRDVWVCYHTVHEFVHPEFLEGRAIASLFYFNANSPESNSLLYRFVSGEIEYESPIRVYYTIK